MKLSMYFFILFMGFSFQLNAAAAAQEYTNVLVFKVNCFDDENYSRYLPVIAVTDAGPVERDLRIARHINNFQLNVASKLRISDRGSEYITREAVLALECLLESDKAAIRALPAETRFETVVLYVTPECAAVLLPRADLLRFPGGQPDEYMLPAAPLGGPCAIQ